MHGAKTRSDKRGAGAVKILAAVVIVAAVAAVNVGLYNKYNENSIDFGLSTTSTTLSQGGSVYIIPQYGIPSSDVKWTSSDTNIATVSDDGEVTISENAQNNSTVTITAKLKSDVKPCDGSSLMTIKSGSATCKITVGNNTSAGTKIYNLTSHDYDFAIIGKAENDAFSKGILALSFNANGNMVVSLAGYDKSWLGKGYNSTGNIIYDWVTGGIIVTITDPNGSQYTNTLKTVNREVKSSNPDNINYHGPTVVVKSGNLAKGNYSVEVKLYGRTSTITTSASFEYKTGDGSLDCTGNIYRQYTWVYDNTIYTWTYEMNYSRYETFLAKNIKNFEKMSTSAIQVNYSKYDDIIDIMAYGPEITDIADKLKKIYNQGSNSIQKDEKYAGFILAFVQICFYYEYDAHMYGQPLNSMVKNTDYWASPAEVIYLGCGDCDDTSILTAALLIASGYSAGVTLLPSHAIASVALDSCSTKEYGNNKIRADTKGINETVLTYYGCETTTEYAYGIGLVNTTMDKKHDYSKTGKDDCKVAMYVKYNDEWYSF